MTESIYEEVERRLRVLRPGRLPGSLVIPVNERTRVVHGATITEDIAGPEAGRLLQDFILYGNFV